MPLKLAILLTFIQSSAVYAVDSLECKGAFDDSGRKQGTWVCRKNGQVTKKERYRNGNLITYMLFDSKGKVVETRNRRGKVRKYKGCGC